MGNLIETILIFKGKKVTLRETRVFLPTLRETLEGEKTDP